MTEDSYEIFTLTSDPKAKVVKFGDEDLSDVTFIVDGKEFKCHKMTLASRSSYFKAMFFSNFKEKDQENVKIEADPVAFQQLMEMIYLGEFSDWRTVLRCGKNKNCTTCRNTAPAADDERCASISELWKSVSNLLKLADQWDILSYAVTVLQNYFMRSLKCNCQGCQGKDCPRSGTKLLISLIYGMSSYKWNSDASKYAVLTALSEIKKVEPAVHINTEELQWLLERK